MRSPRLSVNGVKYGGWQTVQIVRSLESIAGSFQFTAFEPGSPWPIVEGDKCELYLGDEKIITGYVDARSMELSAESHTLSVVGRDRTGDLIDCSAVLDDLEFIGLDVLAISKKVCAPFGISVSLQAGVTLPPAPKRVVINPGDTVHDVIDRACRLAGVFAISDPDGNLVITKAGTAQTRSNLIEGQNILTARAVFDASARYRRYIVNAQLQADDDISGVDAASIRGEAIDMSVARSARVLVVRAEGGASILYTQQRASWEANVRAARSDTVTITVQGWEQTDGGDLWPVNAPVVVSSPALGVTGLMLISEVVYSLDASSGTTTELTLRGPNAFLPEPEISADEQLLFKDE